ncbi:Capsular glucan synthase [Jannaschia seosinensis]|uniref:Capsular glucan synthase n=1 Tax=Jannaschia seosinensis TaxID=313367 RepID=A0A0M7B6D7_9RHOB|nr:glycosyltransferase family 4 protein [Jannaschia seosinensis]CUH13347.1 Capsular glucan synthase [Jannaschia seosinensis]
MTSVPMLERVLITVDAVGGVWRWTVDAARALAPHGASCVIVGLGPEPSEAQAAEIAAIPNAELVWLEQPLEWLASGDAAMCGLPEALATLAREREVDLIHVNAPAQAADLSTGLPVVAASHSCVVTWWRAMRDEPLPAEWQWQFDRNLRGMETANLVLTPSAAHATALREAYPVATPVATVLNASTPVAEGERRDRQVLAAARWWDDAKNGATLDAAAARINAPVVMAGALESPAGARFDAKHAQAAGPMPADEVRRRMSSAAVFVSPSIYEPFGLSTLEAAGSGTALVLSDIPIYRELWQGAALFCDPHHPDGFAVAVNRLLADEALRQNLGLAARRKAQKLSLDRQARELLSAWGRAMIAHGESPAAPAIPTYSATHEVT